MKAFWAPLILGVVLVLLQNCSCEDDTADGSNIEIVGLGDNCGGESVCDPKSHLTCFKLQCHCDSGKNFTLDDTGVSCVLAEDSDELFSYEEEESSDEEDFNYNHDHDKSPEKGKDNDTQWPEDDSGSSEWQLPENNTGEGIKQKSGKVVDDKDDQTKVEDSSPEQPDPKSSNATNESSSSSVVVVDVSADDKKTNPQDPDVQTSAKKGEPDQQKSEPEVPSQQQKVEDGPNHDDTEDDSWVPDEGDDIMWSNSNEESSGDNSWVLTHCAQNSDCTQLSFGQYSICNLKEGRCECSDTDGKHRKTLLNNGTCYIWKELGSDCTTHEECDASISGPAWCHTDKSSATSFCTCQPFHVWDEVEAECLPIVTSGVGSPCQNDDQCTPEEALGPFSKCSELTGTCECMPALGPKTKRVISFQDKCVEERELGEDCETDQQCQASLGSSAHCHPLAQTCSCRPGHFCNKMLVRPAMSGFTLLVLIALCVSVGLGSVLCFVFRRRGGQGEGTYSFIQQQNDV